MRLLAPQTQENPVYFHVTSSKSADFRRAVDQLAEVGFEMILYRECVVMSKLSIPAFIRPIFGGTHFLSREVS